MVTSKLFIPCPTQPIGFRFHSGSSGPVSRHFHQKSEASNPDVPGLKIWRCHGPVSHQGIPNQTIPLYIQPQIQSHPIPSNHIMTYAWISSIGLRIWVQFSPSHPWWVTKLLPHAATHPQESLERDQTWTRDVSGRHEDTMDQRPIKHKLTNDENVHEYHECTYDQTPRNMNLLLTKLDIQSKRMVTSPQKIGCPSTHTKLTLPTPSTPHFWSFWTHFRDPLWHNQVSWEAWYTRKTRAGSWLQSGFKVLAPVAPDGSRFITFHHQYPSHPHIMNQNVSECITSIHSPVSHVLWLQILCGQDAGYFVLFVCFNFRMFTLFDGANCYL